MRRGVFVTGTDTGVGKTVVAAALLHRYRGRAPVRYWKPIQTGIEIDDDTAEVERLGRCDETEIVRAGVRLARPVSPHLAARWAGRLIDVAELVDIADAQPPSACLVVEGAGGVLVPINDAQTMADLMRAIGLAVVVVARSTLGTINHTLLTLEALRQRGLRVAGVVMVGAPNADNRAAIEGYGQAPVVGEMPMFDPIGPDRLAAWAATELDSAGALMEFFS